MSAEKRKVSTDALETLGTIIQGGGRDAIHLAVEPVIAGHTLYPGAHVGISGGKAYSNLDKAHPSFVEKHLGIVDPFLKEPVRPGEMFWLVVYPRQITSLRHVWDHPDFPTEEGINIGERVADKLLGGSEQWIRDFADKLDMTYSALMKAAHNWHTSGTYEYDNSEVYKDHYDKFQEFWEHYEKVTGIHVDPTDKQSFFTCSC